MPLQAFGRWSTVSSTAREPCGQRRGNARPSPTKKEKQTIPVTKNPGKTLPRQCGIHIRCQNLLEDPSNQEPGGCACQRVGKEVVMSSAARAIGRAAMCARALRTATDD